MDLIHGNNTWIRNIERLLDGRVDAVYAPLEANMLATIRDTQANNKVRLLKIMDDKVTLYTIFSAHHTVREQRLLKRYDKAFKQIDGQKVFENIFNNYLSMYK